jgi:hypothetical protein
MPKFSDPTSRVRYLLAKGRVKEAIAASEISCGMRPQPRWKTLLSQGLTSQAVAASEASLGMLQKLRRGR